MQWTILIMFWSFTLCISKQNYLQSIVNIYLYVKLLKIYNKKKMKNTTIVIKIINNNTILVIAQTKLYKYSGT